MSGNRERSERNGVAKGGTTAGNEVEGVERSLTSDK